MSLAYWGSKRKFAREIADVLCEHDSAPAYYEPFCGMASVGVEVLTRGCFTRMLWSDANADVVAYWKGLQRGWIPSTDTITQAQWDAMRRDRTSSARRSFYGFHLGYGGQFLAGRSPNADLNRPGPMKRVRDRVQETSRKIQSVGDKLVVRQQVCDALRPRRGSVIYCDPPYVLEEGKPNSNRKHVGVEAMNAIWQCIQRWVVDHECVVYLSASREARKTLSSLRLVLVKEWSVLNRMQQSKLGVAHYRKELLFRVVKRNVGAGTMRSRVKNFRKKSSPRSTRRRPTGRA